MLRICALIGLYLLLSAIDRTLFFYDWFMFSKLVYFIVMMNCIKFSKDLKMLTILNVIYLELFYLL